MGFIRRFWIGLVLLLVITEFPWIALIFPLWVLLVSTYILYSDFHNVRGLHLCATR